MRTKRLLSSWSARAVIVLLAIAALLGIRLLLSSPLQQPAVGPKRADSPEPSRTLEELPGAGRLAVHLGEPAQTEPKSDPNPCGPLEGQLLVQVLIEPESLPFAGATLSLVEEGKSALLARCVVRSDEHGIADFGCLRAGNYRLFCDRAASQPQVIRAGEVTQAVVILSAGVLVEGRVIDSEDQPVPDAEILMSDRLELHDFYGSLGSTEMETFDQIANLVSDSSSRLIRPDGKMEMPAPASSRVRSSVIARSAGDGTFTLRGIERGRYVSARKSGYLPSNLVSLTAAEGGREELTLRLPGSSGSVRGRVVDFEGAPIEGAMVEIGDPNAGTWQSPPGKPWSPSGRPQCVATDQDGRFAADSLFPGNIVIKVCAEGWAPGYDVVKLQGTETQSVTIRLDKGVTIEGRVLDEHGTPVAGAKVQSYQFFPVIAPGLVRTDVEGRYALSNVAPAGRKRVVLVAADAGPLGIGNSTAFDVGFGDVVQLDVVVRLGKALTGVVRAEDGSPLVGWRVSAAPHARPRDVEQLANKMDIGKYTVRGQAQTDAAGRFVIPACLDQAYELIVSPPSSMGRRPAHVARDVIPGGPPLELQIPPAGIPSSEFHLHLASSKEHGAQDYYVQFRQTDRVYGVSRAWYLTVPVQPGGDVDSGPTNPGDYDVRIMRGDSLVQSFQSMVEPGCRKDLGTIELP